MIKLLPFILIPILIVAGLGYWRYNLSKHSLTTPQSAQKQDLNPIEVPKTLPGATIEDRVKSLEDTITKLAAQVNILKATPVPASADARLNNVEAAVTELKARVSALEKATPAPQSSSSKSIVYIPLGAGGYWANQAWYTLTDYQVNLDPANFPGYSGMVLEITFRLSEAAGTGYVRLYNTTDNSTTSSEVTTTSTDFKLVSSSSFKLASGNKNYALQVKNSEGKNLFLQTARIRVNF